MPAVGLGAGEAIVCGVKVSVDNEMTNPYERRRQMAARMRLYPVVCMRWLLIIENDSWLEAVFRANPHHSLR
jgi:hypothetical protein